MRFIARIPRTRLALPMLCAVGVGGCSADFAASFCASERQSMSIDGFSSAMTTQSGVSIGIGDSVRLVARGFCRDPGLHIAIGTRATHWHSHDDAIVRLSPAPAMEDAQSGEMATVWAVGLTPGTTIVSGELGESGAALTVHVLPP